MFQFPDIFGTRRRASLAVQAQAEEALQAKRQLAADRTALGEQLYTALLRAVSERDPGLHFGVRLGKLSSNGGCFSIVYGFNENNGREIPWHEGGGQFDIKLDNTPFQGGDGKFHALFGKYGSDQYYNDFTTFLHAACNHVRTVK